MPGRAPAEFLKATRPGLHSTHATGPFGARAGLIARCEAIEALAPRPSALSAKARQATQAQAPFDQQRRVLTLATMASVTARGALPLATARPRRLRRLLPAAAAAAPLGPGSVAARLAQQLRQLKQFKVRSRDPCGFAHCWASCHSLRYPTLSLACQVWDAPAASASGNAHPAARGGRQPGATLQGAPTDGEGAPGAASGRRPGVVWFRGDLRLHDHEALARAQAECSSLLPVYCFDPRDYGKSPQGHEKTGGRAGGGCRAQLAGDCGCGACARASRCHITAAHITPLHHTRTGPFRALFLAEAVADLRVALRAAGSELVVRLGRPEEVIGELVRRTGAGAVYCHTEVSGGL